MRDRQRVRPLFSFHSVISFSSSSAFRRKRSRSSVSINLLNVCRLGLFVRDIISALSMTLYSSRFHDGTTALKVQFSHETIKLSWHVLRQKSISSHLCGFVENFAEVSRVGLKRFEKVKFSLLIRQFLSY